VCVPRAPSAPSAVGMSLQAASEHEAGSDEHVPIKMLVVDADRLWGTQKVCSSTQRSSPWVPLGHTEPSNVDLKRSLGVINVIDGI